MFVIFVLLLFLFPHQAAAINNSCQPHDPPQVLISSNVKGTLSPGEKTSVSLTLQNCSGQSWLKSANFKLGSLNPANNQFWGTGRIELPHDVPHQESVQINFDITAPTTPGSYPFQWGILQEGVHWLSPALPPQAILVGKTVLCSSANSLVNTDQDAQPIIQQCLDNANEGDVVLLNPGKYTVNHQIRISKTLSLATAGMENSQQEYCVPAAQRCAHIVAAATYPQSPQAGDSLPYGILRVQKTDGSPVDRVGIKNIIIDGNRSVRQTPQCIQANTCVSSSFLINNGLIYGNTFINGVSWTAMEMRGDKNTLAYNYIGNNGTKAYRTLAAHEVLPMTWSDGFSIINVKDVTVMNNTFFDNTDVDLILWGAARARVHFNKIEHLAKNQESFAALSMGASTAQNPDFADFTDAIFSYNTINCRGLCGVGIAAGIIMFSQDYERIYGATVENNIVTGAMQGINVEGGSPTKPLIIGVNKIEDTRISNTSCGFSTSALNIATFSKTTLKSGVTANSGFDWPSSCKIPSCIFGSQYCLSAQIGDANNSGNVDLLDFAIWKKEYLGKVDTKTADFNHDNLVNLLDFALWKKAYLLN